MQRQAVRLIWQAAWTCLERVEGQYLAERVDRLKHLWYSETRQVGDMRKTFKMAEGKIAEAEPVNALASEDVKASIENPCEAIQTVPSVVWDGGNGDAVVTLHVSADYMRRLTGMAEMSNQSLLACTTMVIDMALMNYLEQGL